MSYYSFSVLVFVSVVRGLHEFYNISLRKKRKQKKEEEKVPNALQTFELVIIKMIFICYLLQYRYVICKASFLQRVNLTCVCKATTFYRVK